VCVCACARSRACWREARERTSSVPNRTQQMERERGEVGGRRERERERVRGELERVCVIERGRVCVCMRERERVCVCV
jgi:hypothetical protein